MKSISKVYLEKMARLEIDVNQDEMKAEKKRRIREENRKLRIRSEREKEAKISGISIYSIFSRRVWI